MRKLAGVRKIRFHDTRHTVASMLDFLGVQLKVAQTIMGHSSAITTQQYYQHAYNSQIENALELVEQAIQTPKTAQSDETGRLAGVFDSSGSRQKRFLSGLASLLSLVKPLRLELRTPCLKDRSATSVRQRVTDIDASLGDGRRRWLVGVVAVNLAVNDTRGR
ncbi:tyrosine-type recombinase/integrase [Streptomyces phaeochromogenes]|uniref:tyrosine-type recombinase/integrase n=1 Tax=Streptomyces phaeochromogenes TaxID=1923 RepID=UPI003868EE65|nr:tyrosine-type recombinase/integrase [Streptomyces phaeochromogenes]